jgi:hypothetical protein
MKKCRKGFLQTARCRGPDCDKMPTHCSIVEKQMFEVQMAPAVHLVLFFYSHSDNELCSFQHVQIDTIVLPRHSPVANLQVVTFSLVGMRGEKTLISFR